MTVASAHSLTAPQRRRVALILIPASVLILITYAAARYSPTAVQAEFLDNLHWTIAYSIGALLAWCGVRWSDAVNRPARRWFAYGLTLWAIGQLVWDFQTAMGWNPYPAPSDAFFLSLGPCFVIGLIQAIRNHETRPLSTALIFDAGTLATVVLALAVAIYFPNTDSEGLALAILIGYPIGMFAPCCLAIAMIPTLKLRPDRHWLPFIAVLMLNGAAWMQWIYLAQNNRLESNPWVYLLFSAVPLALGYGVLNWRLVSTRDPVWERRYDSALRMLPLFLVGIAAMSTGIAWSLPGIPPIIAASIYTCSGVVMILVIIRINLQLLERDRLLAMQARASELERTFSTLFRITRGGLALLDASGRFLEVNPSCGPLFGLKRAQLRQANIKELCELRHSPLRGPLGLLDADGSGVLETDGIRSDGARVQLELTSAAIPDTGGRIFVIFRDITERKRAELELRSLAQRLFLATRSAGLGIWELRLRDHTLLWDARMHELYGVEPQTFRGRHEDWERRVHPGDRARMQALLDDAIAGKCEYRGEFRIVRPDGQTRDIETYALVQMDTEGRPEHLIGVNWDVTERKEAAARQQRLETQLRQSQKLEAIGTLASGIAHDFNNVLGVILGNIELALLDIDEHSPALTSLQETRKAAHRGRDLVRRIVAFGRPQEHNARPIALAPVVDEAVKLARAALPASVEIRCNAAASAPAVSIDASQITQVILNLCMNAYQSMRDGKGRVDLTLDVQELGGDAKLRNPDLHEGRYVCLRVRDTGCGIDPSIADRIFEPFFSTKPIGEGSGLGLYVAHNIVRAHGGAVCVDSTVGAGSVFHIYLPAVSAAGHDASPAAVTPPPPRQANRHVFYVDDEEPLVFLTRRLLERFGYYVSGFTDAATALAAFAVDPGSVDLVITDYSMPGKCGTELAREMLAIRPDTRVVLVSGYLRPYEIEQARTAGIQEVILKPDTVDELAAAVHRLLASDEPAANAGAGVY